MLMEPRLRVRFSRLVGGSDHPVPVEEGAAPTRAKALEGNHVSGKPGALEDQGGGIIEETAACG
jgi:hypothetical protein